MRCGWLRKNGYYISSAPHASAHLSRKSARPLDEERSFLQRIKIPPQHHRSSPTCNRALEPTKRWGITKPPVLVQCIVWGPLPFRAEQQADRRLRAGLAMPPSVPSAPSPTDCRHEPQTGDRQHVQRQIQQELKHNVNLSFAGSVPRPSIRSGSRRDGRSWRTAHRSPTRRRRPAPGPSAHLSSRARRQMAHRRSSPRSASA